ncbi:MAG: hypothetical protein JWP91_3154 [Fibrobacteres bacterium]|nr:hypothetical protein [Fibrobacterota bacterium]
MPFNTPSRARAGIAILGLLSVAGLDSCLNQEKADDPVSTEKAFVFTVNSDYKTGSYSATGIDSAFVSRDIDAIHSDAGVRYLGGNDIFVLNRFGRDNLQVVDRHNLKTVLQVAFPALSNPHDIAVKDSLLYVGFYGAYSKIGIYKQSDGTKAGEIDLAAYADTADHFPEVTELLFIGKDLYALIANMDNKTYGFLQGRLAKIDVATKEVKVLDLPISNPVSMSYDKAANKLYIPCRGAFFKPGSFTDLELDGGIVGVKLSAFSIADTLATEAALGGSLGKAYLDDGRLIMDLTATAGEKLVAISLKDGKAEEWASLKPYSLGGTDIDAKNGTLYIGDRENGLRFFDLATGKEKDGSPIRMSDLPISDLAVIR